MTIMSKVIADLPRMQQALQVAGYLQFLNDMPEVGLNLEAADPLRMRLIPGHCQTEAGLAIEERDGRPWRLHTPFGLLEMPVSCGPKEWRQVTQEHESPLMLNLHRHLYFPRTGHGVGPMWEVCEWDGNHLPPVRYRPWKAYHSEEELMRAWQEVFQKKMA